MSDEEDNYSFGGSADSVLDDWRPREYFPPPPPEPSEASGGGPCSDEAER